MSQISEKEVGSKPGSYSRRSDYARRVSNRIAQVEAPAAGVLIAIVFALLIANVVTRAMTMPVYWIDELAIYTMIWSAFVGASLCLNKKSHIAVTLLPDMLPARIADVFLAGVNLLLIAFFMVFAHVLWRWFDPVTVMTSESLNAFSQATFNFIYDEPTTTIGMRKIWFWLILPVFCLTGFLHSFANLLDVIARLKRGEG